MCQDIAKFLKVMGKDMKLHRESESVEFLSTGSDLRSAGKIQKHKFYLYSFMNPSINSTCIIIHKSDDK